MPRTPSGWCYGILPTKYHLAGAGLLAVSNAGSPLLPDQPIRQLSRRLQRTKSTLLTIETYGHETADTLPGLRFVPRASVSLDNEGCNSVNHAQSSTTVPWLQRLVLLLALGQNCTQELRGVNLIILPSMTLSAPSRFPDRLGPAL